MPSALHFPPVERRSPPRQPRLRSRWLGRLLPGVALLAGCAAYPAKPLSAPAANAAFERRTLADPALRQFIERHGAPGLTTTWPPASWNLRLLTLAAFFHHSDIEEARARLAAAEAALVTAGARPNPTVGFTPTFDVNPAGGLSPWTLGFALDLPLETGGRRGLRLAQGQQLANSARLHFAATAWQVRSRVRQSLAELEGDLAAREILTRQQATEDQIVALLEARWKAGENALTEVRFARVAAAQTRLGLDEATQQCDQARIRLADAIGVPAAALADVTVAFGDLDRLPPADEAGAARREALLNRPDVLAALADYQASEAALRLAVARQYPEIHLGPGYAWDQGESKFTLGLSLTLPVFSRERGPMAEAEAHRREAAATFNARQARAISEVGLAFAGYRDALRKLATADRLLRDERERLESMQQAFAAGAIDRIGLLQARLELERSERVRATTFNEAQRALGGLEDAMQRPAGPSPAAPVPASLLRPSEINP